MSQKFIAMLYSTVNWNDMRRHDYKIIWDGKCLMNIL